jgi:hypothetical protein
MHTRTELATAWPQPARREAGRYIDIPITVALIGAGRFKVRHAGRILIASSSTPFCDAARRLIAEGFPPGAILAMRHQGEPDFALRGKLGQVARFTIEDGPNGRPRVRRYRASHLWGVESPVRLRAMGVR